MKRNLLRFLSLTLALLLSVSLLSPAALAEEEGEDTDTPTTPTTVPVTGIKLSSKTLSLSKDNKATLTATVEPSDASEQTVTWASENHSVATVSNGTVSSQVEVTAVGGGETRIIASCGGKSNYCKVTVTVPVSGISLDESELTLNVGDTETLKATVEPEDATDQQITWKSSNASVVSVGQWTGELTARAKGTATITATCGGKSATRKITVIEVPVTGVSLDESEISLTAGGTKALKATIAPSNATNKKVTWSSDNTKVADVSEKGMVTALGVGDATITATTDDGEKTATCQVTVGPSTVTDIRLSPSLRSYTLEKGEAQIFSVTFTPSNATEKTVTWSSSDDKIATVDGGKVTGKAPGTATITATSKDGGKTASVEITVSGIILDDYPASGGSAVRPNGTATLIPHKFGKAADVKSWEWRTDDKTIARVTAGGGGGVVTGIAEGTATITCVGGGYTASCKVKVARSTSSTIRASLDDGLLRFSSITSSFSDFSYLSGLTVPPAQGTLYHGYVSNDNPGSGVASADRYYRGGGNPRQISDVVFVPKTDFDGEAVIRFSGYNASGSATSGEIVVPVRSDEASLDYSVPSGGTLRFPVADFNDYCTTLTGKGLSYVTFTLPSSRYGKLYYNYTDADIYERTVSSGDRFYRSGSPSLASVALVADTGYQGVFQLNFTGYDTSGKSFSGSARITVGDGGAPSGIGDINYSVAPGRRVDFDADDFDDLCRDLNDRGLDYVYFTSLPSSSQGVLYCDGSKISTSFRCDYDDDLEDVYFRADEDFDGTVSIPFTGYDTRGGSFRGTVEIEVYDGGSGSSGDLVYSVDPGRRVYFDEEDFNDFCNEEQDRDLNYIRFTSLPSSSRGVLYYNRDTKVSTGTNYYYDGSNRRLIEDLSFVADDDYGGTANLSFTGYDERGGSFTGTVEIRIGWDEGDTDISYTTRPGSRVAFEKKDFSDASYSAANRQLSHVRFTSLPSSSRGTLYYDGDTYVRTGTSYYYSGSNRLLEDVSFVPASSFTGAVTIPYTGQSANGRSFYGEVKITVSGVSPTTPSGSAAISYSTAGRAVTFKRSDFAQACAGALPTGPATVRLSAPDPSVGSLYFNYASPSQYRTFVSGQSYSATELDQLSFVPKAGFRGTAAVAVTLYDAKGSAWGGVVSIDVTPPASSDYFRDLGSARWAVPAVDFLRRYGVVSGVSASSYGPGLPMRRGDFVLMLNNAFSFPESLDGSFPDVPRDSYYASAIAAAKAQDIVYADNDGNFRPGSTVTRLDAAILLYRCLQRRDGISPGSAGDLARFSDAGSIPSWAVEAMGALVRRGVFSGDDAGRLNPGSPLTRAEMAAVLYQAIT